MALSQKLRSIFENSEFWRFIGFEFVSCGDGKAEVTFHHKEAFQNIERTMHGGVYMSALDTVMGLASKSLGLVRIVTIQMETRFFESIAIGKVKALGHVIHRTKGTVIAEGRLYNESGVLIGYSTGTFKIID